MKNRLFKKEPGAVHNMLLCLLGFMTVVIVSLVFVKKIEADNLNTEARHAMNLAAKYLYINMPDYDEFTRNGKAGISDENILKMHKMFKEMVAGNMNLEYTDDMFYGVNDVIGTARPNNVIVSGEVMLTDFAVYTVSDSDTVKTAEWTGPVLTTAVGDYGTVFAPDGTLITQSCVYAKIKMNLKGYFGSAAKAEKEIFCMLLNNNNTDEPIGRTGE